MTKNNIKSKLMKIFIYIFSLILLSTNFAFAADNDIRLNKLNFCKITKETENNYEPQSFETNNNLLRETGQESIYCGEKIIITGKVVDENCVPVADAKVYIWQIDCKGKYPYKPLKTGVDETLIHTKKLTTFKGNGVATTNNKGEFHFITLYPPAIHQLASHVNVRIEHRKLGNLQTRFMLKGHRLKNPENYPELESIYQAAAKKNVGIYNYQIVMQGSTEDRY